MPDPLLSSLCIVCRELVAKYKCPRCLARTCSLACSQLHKTRAACNGVRNASAYVPLAQLRTPAAFDHDFNFLRGIERSKELVEKELAETRGLVGAQDIRPRDDDKRFKKVWYGDELRHVPVDSLASTAGSQDGQSPVLRSDKGVYQRIRALNVQVLAMPAGMTRQRENNTSWNRRTATINWQVEWLIFRLEDGSEPQRVLHKVLDNTPLHQGLAESLEWDRSAQRKRKLGESQKANQAEPPLKKPRRDATRKASAKKFGTRDAMQLWPREQATGSWLMQSWHTGRWDQLSSSAAVQTSAEDVSHGFSSWQFFLGSTDHELVPLSATDTLSAALSGRTIVEFPIIYVLGPDKPVPQGFSLGSVERRQPSTEGWQPTERYMRNQRQPLSGRQHKTGWSSAPGARRQGKMQPRGQHKKTAHRPSNEAEEGEINSDGEGLEQDVVMAPSLGPDTGPPVEEISGAVSSKPSGALVDYDSSGDST